MSVSNNNSSLNRMTYNGVLVNKWTNNNTVIFLYKKILDIIKSGTTGLINGVSSISGTLSQYGSCSFSDGRVEIWIGQNSSSSVIGYEKLSIENINVSEFKHLHVKMNGVWACQNSSSVNFNVHVSCGSAFEVYSGSGSAGWTEPEDGSFSKNFVLDISKVKGIQPIILTVSQENGTSGTTDVYVTFSDVYLNAE